MFKKKTVVAAPSDGTEGEGGGDERGEGGKDGDGDARPKKKRKLKEPKPDHRRFCRTCGRERWLHPHGKFGPNCDLDSKLQG